MNSLCFLILAYVLVGQVAHQQYILQHVQPYFFAEECFGHILKVAQTLMLEQRVINLLTIRDALITDMDSAALAARLKAFRNYFVKEGILDPKCTDDEVKKQITILVAQISAELNYSIQPEIAVKSFTVEFVARAKKELLERYKEKLKDSPTTDFSEELMRKLKDLDFYLRTSTWELYVYDLSTLEDESEDVALISYKDEGMFFRGNLYLISGFA